jgi:hypothetical protein
MRHKGRVRFEGALAHVEARALLGLSILVAAWGIGLPIVVGLNVIAGNAGASGVLPLVGLGAFFAVLGSSVRSFEREYMKQLVDEIEAYLAGAPS